MKPYESLITRVFDSEFDILKSKGGLTYFPWVGSDYQKTRFAVVGKWHYFTDSNVKDSDEEYTRRIVKSEGIGNNQKIYKTVLELLFSPAKLTLDDRRRFWAQCAFFNMGKKQEAQGRPRILGSADFNAFHEIAGVILPTHCLFVGVSLSECSTQTELGKLGITVTLSKTFYENNMEIEIATLSKGSWSAVAAFTKYRHDEQKPLSTDHLRNYMPKFF